MQSYAKNVYIFVDLLTENEIKEILQKYNHDKHYNIRFNRKSYRKCDKQIIIDDEISKLVWERLKNHIHELTTTEGRKTWIPFRCSNRIKLIRYKPGDSFSWHVDASNKIDDCKVTFSVTIYLNTVPKKFKGATEFKPNTRIPLIQPKQGMGMLLNTLYGPEHRGGELKGGEKFILRLDVLATLSE